MQIKRKKSDSEKERKYIDKERQMERKREDKKV